MLRQRSIRIAQQERQQRVALIFFALALLGVGIFCAVLGWGMLARDTRTIPAGRVDQYVTNVPQRLVVKKLSVSSWVQRRPTGSEDVIFVMHDQDNQWRAYLGLDTLTGCFLDWQPQVQLFTAANDPLCLGSRYTPDGRYLDGIASGEPPQSMALLPVEIRSGSVFVLDQLAKP